MAKIKWAPAPEMVRWNRLKSLRRERGMTQPELAVGADLAVATIYHIEAGHDDRTTEEVKQKLARFFDCDVEDLFPVEMIGDRPRDKVLVELANQPRRR